MAVDRGVDFLLSYDDSGNISMSYEKSENILNNIILSIDVQKGKYALNRNFSSRVKELTSGSKNITDAETLLKQFIEEGLQWLLDIGRAKSIEIETEAVGLHRIDITVTAEQMNGIFVPYSTFFSVV